MGRAVLKALKDSTLNTFFEICKMLQMQSGVDYTYNAQSGRIIFSNTSEVYLKDLFLYPRDPEFDSLGSTEYTGAFIDEVSEITEKAKNIVMSRIRFKIDLFKIKPKLLMASNPTKNFAYRDYWKPWRDNKLPKYRQFIPALVGDNPHISDYYAENLMKLDKNSRERLLFGNWDYDDDPSRLFDYDKIIGMFLNIYEPRRRHEQYLTVDVARFGSDRTVIMQWQGLDIVKIKSYDKTSTKEVREIIESICYHEHIPRWNVIVDEDGVGGGVVDETDGVKGFVNNATPIEIKEEPTAYTMPKKHNYSNLKSQCYFALSKAVYEGKITCYDDIPIDIKDLLIEDLQQIKAYEVEKDKKLAIIPKEKIIESLGRSPDFSDAMMMRMYFELKPDYKPYIAI